MTSLLCAEHKFNCGITGLRKSEKRSPGRPSASTTDENFETVKKIILDNRRFTIGEVADDVGISFGSCQTIFMDVLRMKRVAAKIVPKLLNFEQTMDIAQEMLTIQKKKIITGDESWL